MDLRDFPGDEIQEKIVHDFDIILNDPEVSVIVEAMGGVEPAYTFVKKALLNGKSVATPNKALVAEHGSELLEIAKEKNLNFMFEASVGGGIPIIRPLNSSLTADEIQEITGILNGTTNYILTKMTNEGSDFQDALEEAQEMGYAERNPEADIEGYDACRKIAILTSLVCGKHVNYRDIYTEGITRITAADIKYVKKMDKAVKLLATSKKIGDSFCTMVAPAIIGKTHPLYSVCDVFNGIFVRGNVLGDAMFYGSGAGKLPTASAVVADVIDIVKHFERHIMVEWSSKQMNLIDKSNSEKKFFVRIPLAKKEEAVKEFGDVEFIQVEGLENEIGFITSVISEKTYEEKAKNMNVINMIRVEA